MPAEDENTTPIDCENSNISRDVGDMSDERVRADTAVFSALANDTRYQILRLVISADNRVCGCELEPHLEVGQSSISQSLSHLHDAGLLSRTKEGRWRYYEATEIAEKLIEVLDKNHRVSTITA